MKLLILCTFARCSLQFAVSMLTNSSALYVPDATNLINRRFFSGVQCESSATSENISVPTIQPLTLQKPRSGSLSKALEVLSVLQVHNKHKFGTSHILSSTEELNGKSTADKWLGRRVVLAASFLPL